MRKKNHVRHLCKFFKAIFYVLIKIRHIFLSIAFPWQSTQKLRKDPLRELKFTHDFVSTPSCISITRIHWEQIRVPNSHTPILLPVYTPRHDNQSIIQKLLNQSYLI